LLIWFEISVFHLLHGDYNNQHQTSKKMFALKKRPTSSDDLPIFWQRFLGFKPVGKEKLETWKYVGISIFLWGIPIAGWFISWKIRQNWMI